VRDARVAIRTRGEAAMNLNDPNDVKEQYRTSENLLARIALHERFSTASRRWFDWFFEQLALPREARVLEVGCGAGALWRENRARIPPGWQLTLTDLSLGMLETARAAGVPAHFAQSDAQAIPFPSASFDAVLANHMLYHVPNLSRALAELGRVLKPGGVLFAATNGTEHMRELNALVAEFLGVACVERASTFHRENGHAILSPYFDKVRWLDFPDALIVTQVEPLVAYLRSGFFGERTIREEHVGALRAFIAARLARDGAIRITKSTGVFVAEGWGGKSQKPKSQIPTKPNPK